MKKKNGKEGFAPKEILELVSDEPERQLDRETRAPPAEDSVEADPHAQSWHKAKDKIQKKVNSSLQLLPCLHSVRLTLRWLKGLLESGLKASGAVPDSFSDSTLGPLSNDPDYSYNKFLTPKLTESNLNFKNFYWDPKENKVCHLILDLIWTTWTTGLKNFFFFQIRNKLVSFQKVFMINKCTNIPLPNKDGTSMLPNISPTNQFDDQLSMFQSSKSWTVMLESVSLTAWR